MPEFGTQTETLFRTKYTPAPPPRQLTDGGGAGFFFTLKATPCHTLLDMSLNGYPQLAFLDTETTGTWPGKHELLDIGVVLCDAEPPYGITGSFEIKVKPERMEDAEPRALEVNHYNEEEWEDALPEKVAIEEFVYKIRGSSCWGWNVGFDRAFLETAMNRAGHGLETVKIDFTWYDVKMLFIQWALLVGREEEFAPRFGLNRGLRAFGIQNDDAHRALPDAIATYKMFTRLQDEFEQLGGKLKQSALGL